MEKRIIVDTENKFSVAMWVISLAKTCETHKQIKNVEKLVVRHILLFRDFELSNLMYKNIARIHHELPVKL